MESNLLPSISRNVLMLWRAGSAISRIPSPLLWMRSTQATKNTQERYGLIDQLHMMAVERAETTKPSRLAQVVAFGAAHSVTHEQQATFVYMFGQRIRDAMPEDRNLVFSIVNNPTFKTNVLRDEGKYAVNRAVEELTSFTGIEDQIISAEIGGMNPSFPGRVFSLLRHLRHS